MKAESLLSLAVRVAAEESTQGVLRTIVQGCAAQPDVALARIWLLLPGDICDCCFMRAECRDQTRCFHLAASAGTPVHSPGEDWSFLDGHFRRMPVNAQKVGKVGGSGVALLIGDVSSEREQIARPEWAQREGIRSFAGYPLVFRGKILGVLGIFTRPTLDEQSFGWMKIFADQAAVAIANARFSEERNRAVEALRRSEEDYRTVVETATDAVISVDRDSRILFVNSATAKMFGYEREELIGGSLTELMPEYLRELHRAGLKRYVTTSRRHISWEGTELIGLKKSGQEFPVEVSFGEVIKDGQQIFTGFIRDISERKHAEEQLRQREQSLRRLTETIPEMLWSAAPDGAIDYVNQYVLDYTGLSADQIRGKGWMRAVHAEDVGRMSAAWASSIATGCPYECEFRGFRAADHSFRCCLARALPLHDQAGHIVKWYGTVTDLDDWKRAQEALRESEEELRQLIEGIPQLIWRASADGSVEYHNQRLLAYHGRPMEEMRGTGFAKTIHPDDRERAMKARAEGMAASSHFEYEARLLGADGQYRWFLLRGMPLLDRHGAVAKWYGTWTDIENRKQLEQTLQLENAYLQEQVNRQFTEIVGQSPAVNKVLTQIQMVAPTDSSVLILGESGTGKELVARAIHNTSRRRDQRLVVVNCASIPRELFESEFFGHIKGAFTGALHDRIGRFQLADKGTIFLDEVGEIPFELQSKLLRVLQEGEFERLGEDRPRQVDVRVIAATNRDLNREVETGHFRKDLYYRLCVFPVYLPPLRERREDIGPLAAHLLKITSQRLNCPNVRITDSIVEHLSRYDWPGNIRELQNVIERGVIVTQSGPLRLDLVLSDSPARGRGSVVPFPDSSRSAAAGQEEEEILSTEEMKGREYANTLAALKKTNWKIYGRGGAAEILGIKPTTLVSRMKRMGIVRPRRSAS
jgi:PAS domain S-box-containing protein